MTSKRLEIEISLRSPLMIGTDGESTLYNQTRDYIPGAAMRGALAGTMQSAGARGDFEALFGEQATGPVFDNLYPSRSGSQTYPLPLSARTCKYHPGFKSREGEHHGIGDILIWQAVFEAMLDNRVSLPCLYEPRCPECHSEVKPLSGYYEVVTGQYERTTAPVRRISRTAIERRRCVAADRCGPAGDPGALAVPGQGDRRRALTGSGQRRSANTERTGRFTSWLKGKAGAIRCGRTDRVALLPAGCWSEPLGRGCTLLQR
jgi:hypothetical protein